MNVPPISSGTLILDFLFTCTLVKSTPFLLKQRLDSNKIIILYEILKSKGSVWGKNELMKGNDTEVGS